MIDEEVANNSVNKEKASAHISVELSCPYVPSAFVVVLWILFEVGTCIVGGLELFACAPKPKQHVHFDRIRHE